MGVAVARLELTSEASANRGSVNRDDSVRVNARSFESIAAPSHSGSKAPMIQLASNPSSFAYWWGTIEYAFDIDDPRAFPPCPRTGGR